MDNKEEEGAEAPSSSMCLKLITGVIKQLYRLSFRPWQEQRHRRGEP